jgi:hypothetical protein
MDLVGVVGRRCSVLLHSLFLCKAFLLFVTFLSAVAAFAIEYVILAISVIGLVSSSFSSSADAMATTALARLLSARLLFADMGCCEAFPVVLALLVLAPTWAF